MSENTCKNDCHSMGISSYHRGEATVKCKLERVPLLSCKMENNKHFKAVKWKVPVFKAVNWKRTRLSKL